MRPTRKTGHSQTRRCVVVLMLCPISAHICHHLWQLPGGARAMS